MPTGKIIIVDDEQDVREAIKLQLAGKKFQILEEGDGAEAIATMKQEDHMTNVGVFLCDIRMPNVDGVECIDYLKKEAPGIPIVVITAFPDAELAASLMKKGIKEYLVKPVEKDKLIAIVDSLWRRKRCWIIKNKFIAHRFHHSLWFANMRDWNRWLEFASTNSYCKPTF